MIDITRESDTVFVTIKDNGGGISPKAENKLFEPYFTTKHKNLGTGIGLYMSYEIIVKHFGGALSAENQQFDYDGNQFIGAEFIIELPIK